MEKVVTVMLVDDEYLAIEDLKTLIDWHSIRLEIVSTARCGKDALRKFESAPVDLIITDISMPDMDGITLIEKIKQLPVSQPCFLLLTAYEEMAYMKRALRLSVEDYLVKDEITPEILIKRLSAIRSKICALNRDSYSYRQKSLQHYFSDRAAHCPQLDGIPDSNLLYLVLVPDAVIPWSDARMLHQQTAVIKMIDTALLHAETFSFDQMENICAVSAYNNKIIMLLHANTTLSTHQLITVLLDCSGKIIASLEKNYALSFSCFYSYIPMDIRTLHKSYFKHQEKLRAHYFMGSRTITALDSDKLFITNQKITVKEDTLQELYEDPCSDLRAFLTEQLDQIQSSHNYYGFIQLISSCFSFFERNFDTLPYDPDELSLTDFRDTRNFLLATISRLCQNRNPQMSYETKQALLYISENYSKVDLSIQEISDKIGMSVTHFSRIFKNDMSETIWEYLTSYRIQKACQMLRTTDAKMYEIAEMVGYSSSQYFSQVFMKKMGLKPLDYRKKERQ